MTGRRRADETPRVRGVRFTWMGAPCPCPYGRVAEGMPHRPWGRPGGVSPTAAGRLGGRSVQACGVPAEPQPASSEPVDGGAPSVMPTLRPGRRDHDGVLAALLLVNAGLLWYGFDATVDPSCATATASPRRRPASSCYFALVPTWGSGWSSLAAWFLPRRQPGHVGSGLSATFVLALITLFSMFAARASPCRRSCCSCCRPPP